MHGGAGEGAQQNYCHKFRHKSLQCYHKYGLAYWAVIQLPRRDQMLRFNNDILHRSCRGIFGDDFIINIYMCVCIDIYITHISTQYQVCPTCIFPSFDCRAHDRMPTFPAAQQVDWNNNVYVIATTRIFVVIGVAYLIKSLCNVVPSIRSADSVSVADGGQIFSFRLHHWILFI